MPESAMARETNSPPHTTDDSNIREGLGSLNRWSQSTTSSKCSPNYASGLQENNSRVFAADTYDCPAAETGNSLNIPPKHVNAPNGDDLLKRYPQDHSVVVVSHTEATVPDVPEKGILPQFSASMTGANPQSNSSTFETAIPPSDSSNLRNLPLEKELVHPATAAIPPIFQSSHSYGPLLQNTASGDENTHSSPGKEKPSEKRRQGHSQKIMLSKALQKANTAVLLDNAANFEGAMEAYNDACQLLQLVMLRSNGGEDEKLKLQEIRDTYMIRVTELQRMDFSFRNSDTKALPERPLSQESFGEIFHTIHEDDGRKAQTGESSSPQQQDPSGFLEEPRKLLPEQIPPRHQSLLPSALDDDLKHPSMSAILDSQVISSHPELPWKTSGYGHEDLAGSPKTSSLDAGNSSYASGLSELSMLNTQARDVYESTSWLDTIDESGASSPSSIRSKASSIYLRHRRGSRLSHCTEAEFDAALDAAVEAAYDEGLEPATESSDDDNNNDDIVANARRNVELAKQKVREAEREAEVAMTRGREIRRIHEQVSHINSADPESDYLDEEAEEEERLLEEMTRGYVMDDFEFDLQSKSALPRQSDSSGLSARTWESSAASNTTAGGGTLSPLAEDVHTQNEVEVTFPATDTNFSVMSKTAPRSSSTPSVRARRMSGQNTVELKIETNTRSKSSSENPLQAQSLDHRIPRPQPLPKDEPPTSLLNHTNKPFAPGATINLSKRNMSISSITDDSSTNSTLDKAITTLEDDELPGPSKMPSSPRPIGKVPSAPDGLSRQNPSLAPFRARNISVPGLDLPTHSPETPSSNAFPVLDLQKGGTTAQVNVLPTPTGANFVPTGLPSGGLYLFDSYIHSPTSPGSPNPIAVNSPLALEPCPESFLLRPFWLMRCIYQTIAHPRGGYLTTKLFIPRDIWCVKNVKIKGVEEKVANCDLLTAALLKLAKVDMYDADAVLEEMQAFESVLDQVQMLLSKKIGSEVGVQGALPLFRSFQAFDDTSTVDPLLSRSSNTSSKSYLSSWRKLRSKNSGFGTTSSLSGSRETNKDNLTISSLPMTSVPNPQSSRRNVSQIQFNGPNANYMSALARLCEAAQVLDQIAQQVEDPGLKHTSQTLVGLELSTRHAAEFFGFYICRFALNDIGIMLDKFIKRGSEWVLI